MTMTCIYSNVVYARLNHSLIKSMADKGFQSSDIAERLGYNARSVRHIVQHHRKTTAKEADMHSRPMPPRKRAPLFTDAEIYTPPADGIPGKPGFEAWQAIHIRKLDVKTAVRVLGLRYPSEVFELLAVHKKHVVEKAEAEARAFSAKLKAEESHRIKSDSKPGTDWIEKVFSKSMQRIASEEGRKSIPEPTSEEEMEDA